MSFMKKLKYEDNKLRLLAIELLRFAKRYYSYVELSQATGLPPTHLCKYAKGHVIPSAEHAEMIVEGVFKLINVEELVKSRVIFHGDIVETYDVYEDPILLDFLSHYICYRFAGKRITKIMCFDDKSLALAFSLAYKLNVPLIIVLKEKESDLTEYIEVKYYVRELGRHITYYIPKKSVSKNDDILMVLDKIYNENIVDAFEKSLMNVKAKLIGVFSLVGIVRESEPKIISLIRIG